MRLWPRRQHVWLTLAAAASAETVRFGYFGEAQPFQVACARGWFDLADVTVACLPQSSGGYVVSKLDEGDLEVALLGSTSAAMGLARGVAMQTFYVAHEKGTSQGLLVQPEILAPPDLDGRTFGTPFGSTAHYHMMFIQTLFPDVSFDLVDCNANCPDKYDEGSIDGAFVWGGTMESMKRRNATMLFPAQVLSDWGQPTFNAISVREDFAARRPDVVARIAGVVARLDADYLDAASTRWGVDDANGYLASVAAAYGASASPTQSERDTAARGLSYFAFVEPNAMLRSAHLGGGIADALKATAQFHVETDTVAAVAPTGTGDVDTYYVNTTARFLADGLIAVDVGVLDAADTVSITSILASADSTCSGTMDLTATTGTLTDGAATSYSDNLACEWRIASSGLVELNFNVFRVWTGDFFEVFDDSTLVAKLHGFDRAWPPLRTNGAMTVKFTTDGVTERAFNYALTDGWSATYDAAASSCDAAYCGAQGTCDTDSGLCTCDAGYGGADCSHATCLGTTTQTSLTGEFRSSPTAPDRDALYPNSTGCRFVVDVGTSFDYVSFTITYDVEPTFDFVALKSGGGDGETWARLSGAGSDTLITVPTADGKASLAFTSDARGRRGGFRATYVAKDAACASDADCGHGTCEGGSCVCVEGYGGLQCSVAHCLDRAPVVTNARPMVMVSQAPGEPVPAAANCTWEFQASADESVRVVVEQLNLEPERSSAKRGDQVVIRSSGATVFILSRTSFQKFYDIATSSISLSLETDRNDVGETYGGFKATAYAVDACPVLGGNCTDQCLTGGPQSPGCYDRGRAVGCACDLMACLPGSYFDESTGGCEICLPETFQSATGRVTSCQKCPNSFFAPASGAATCCQRGCVLVDEACRQCGVDVNEYLLAGATCEAASGTTVATLEIEAGYFRFSPASTFVYRCPVTDDACRGSSPGAEGYCRAHAHGPLCMLCDDHYFRKKEFTDSLDVEASCVSCARTGEQIRQLYSMLVMIVVWVLVIVSLKRLRNRFNREWFEAALIQFVYFGVTMSRCVHIHQVSIPTPLSKQFIRALEVITFDLASLNSIARCHVGSFNYLQYLKLATLGGPALLLVFVVCAAVRAVALVVACGARTPPPRHILVDETAKEEVTPMHRSVIAAVRRDLGRMLAGWMLLISLFHSGICSSIYQIFNCTQTYEPIEREFLVIDYSIRCSGPRYTGYKAYAILCAVLYVTFPMCLFLVLWQARRLAAGQQQRKDRVDDGALSFLTKNLKNEYWWFEVVAILLRSLVTGFFRFIDVKISIVLSLIITIIHRTFVLQMKPYASSGLQHVVEALMRFALSIVLLSVCVVGDLLNDKNIWWITTIVFALNLSCMPLAYQAFVSESYRGVARRLRASEPVEVAEVEELLRSAHADAIREEVQRRRRHMLKEAFEGTLDEASWTYFTGTLLALEGVWASEVYAEEVLQWHVKAMLDRARAAGGDGAIDASAVERSVDIVFGPLSATLTEILSPAAAYERLGRPTGANALLRVYAEVLRPFFMLGDDHSRLWRSRQSSHMLHLVALAKSKSKSALHSPPLSPKRSRRFLVAPLSPAGGSARALLRDAALEPDEDASSPTRGEHLESGMAKLRRAREKIAATRAFAFAREPQCLERFADLALIAHDLNQRAQTRIADAAARVLAEPRGAEIVALASFDSGETGQPALQSAELVAFKDRVGGAALECALDASICVGALHDLANATFPAFRKALEALYPPDAPGIELICDADVSIKKSARMRAKVDEYRREGEAAWPRATRLSDCLRASVVVEGAEHVVAAYQALAKGDGPFKVVRLKNKLAERAKPFVLHVNLAFQAPVLAPLTVEVQIVPKAIFDDQKASHRLYSISRASTYASFRGVDGRTSAAESALEANDDVEAPTAPPPGRRSRVAPLRRS